MRFFIRKRWIGLRISILVKTGARKDEVTVREDGSLLVRVTAHPVEGKANRKVIEVLAKYFDTPKSCISLVAGHKSKQKVVDVN